MINQLYAYKKQKLQKRHTKKVNWSLSGKKKAMIIINNLDSKKTKQYNRQKSDSNK